MKGSAIGFLCDILGQDGDYGFTKEHDRCIELVSELYDKFRDRLKGDELDDFEKLCRGFDGLNADESEMFFKLGFRFAVKLMAECMTD